MAAPAPAQQSTAGPEQAEISLRKSINTKKIQGQEIEGEDRTVGKGDSLWRILVDEKGLPGQKFQSYIVVIRGLNPQLKNLDVLRIGDKVFIPLRPDQVLEARQKTEPASIGSSAPGSGVTTEYKIKAGEYLYQILRSQLKLADERKLAQYYALVKDLNPERKNWDTLVEGEAIRLPTLGPTREAIAAAPNPASGPTIVNPQAATAGESKAVIAPSRATENKPVLPPPVDRRFALASPAKENMDLLAKVAEAIGGQMQQSGEEVIVLKDESLHFDKSVYPVVSNPALRQRVVLDPGNSIPLSLKDKLNDPAVRTPVLPISKELSIREAVSQLLTGLGYQTLPADRPIMIQDQGVAYEARGDWMALGPEQSNKPQEMFVINLSDDPNAVPDYLQAQLVKNGLSWRDVQLSSGEAKPSQAIKNKAEDGLTAIKTWPRSKEEIIDSLLLILWRALRRCRNLCHRIARRSARRYANRSPLGRGRQTNRIVLSTGRRRASKELLKRAKASARLKCNIAALSSREIISKILTLTRGPSALSRTPFLRSSKAPVIKN